VYLWSEESGVQYPRMGENRRNTYVTSLSFSSTQGGNSILAIGHNNGQISLWSLFDESDRFQSQQPNAVACLAFKPVPTRRQSERLGTVVNTEELLVGDELGIIYYYSVEWGGLEGDARWYGAMHLVAKIDIHTQQICGLAWSPDGDYFATGGNDNICCLFEVKDVLAPPPSPFVRGLIPTRMTGLIPDFVPDASLHQTLGSMIGTDFLSHDPFSGEIIRPYRNSYVPAVNGSVLHITEGRQKHKWQHNAAVKAIAFCPWQRGLVASGGGSNDRGIHFYHVYSGACLATISVQAQVTSLIWSTTRREIAATFGYAQPEHPYRIAVFSWPDCRQVVAIPWVGEMRALYAIPYPGGPNEASRQRSEGGRWWSRTAEEGCIVVASSDESVKFHEVWSEARMSTGGKMGLLGGSDILESLEGIEKDGSEVIR
jgi:WD40 repeat protein